MAVKIFQNAFSVKAVVAGLVTAACVGIGTFFFTSWVSPGVEKKIDNFKNIFDSKCKVIQDKQDLQGTEIHNGEIQNAVIIQSLQDLKDDVKEMKDDVKSIKNR